EVLVDRVGARRDEDRHAGAARGEQTVTAVLDHHAARAGQAEPLLREIVDLGIRFLARHDIAGEDELELLLALGAHQVEHAVDGVGVRRRADAEPDARGGSLVDDAVDARTQRQLSARDQLLEELGLELVEVEDERVLVLRLGRPAELVEVRAHPLLAASDLEQLAIEIDVPRDVETALGESAVERDAMAVALRVDEDSVAVEDQSFHHVGFAQATFARTSPARFVPPNCAIFSLKSAFSASNWAPSTRSGS